MRSAILLVALLLGACATTPTASGPSPSATAAPVSSPTPSPSEAQTAAESLPPIASVLPTHLGDFELHTFETGRDSLVRLAAELGVDPGELEFAFASEHGARFVQMTAIRVHGRPARELAEAWAVAGYTPDVDDVQVGEEDVNGELVTVVSSTAAGSRIGTFYLVERGATLVVIQAFDREIVEEALAALP